MSKILVYLYDGMADYEISFLTHILGGDAGKELITMGLTTNIIVSKSGMQYIPHTTIDAVFNTYEEEDYEGLIIPGGWYKEVSNSLVKLIYRLHDDKKLLAAICAGPRFLAKSGILQDVKYTTSVTEWTDTHKDYFEENDPFPRQNYTGERVTVDKNVVTAIGVAFVDFAIAVCDELNLFSTVAEKEAFTHLIKGTAEVV